MATSDQNPYEPPSDVFEQPTARVINHPPRLLTLLFWIGGLLALAGLFFGVLGPGIDFDEYESLGFVILGVGFALLAFSGIARMWVAMSRGHRIHNG